MKKHRLSATVDLDLIQAAEHAVAVGSAENVSAWINTAMRRHAEHEQRIQALAALVTAYESKHGEITREEIDSVSRAVRSRAVIVRAEHKRTPARKAAAKAHTRKSARRA